MNASQTPNTLEKRTTEFVGQPVQVSENSGSEELCCIAPSFSREGNIVQPKFVELKLCAKTHGMRAFLEIILQECGYPERAIENWTLAVHEPSLELVSTF
jgi:hypothetical protein